MMDEAIFAAGCFWGVEASFARLDGVRATEVGYTGGDTDKPTYQQVCTGDTGHAEAIRIEFDPDAISFETLVRHFFEMHDPTTPNRQGPDVGSQYRSAIFFKSPAQEAIARKVVAQLKDQGRFRRPIVTQIVPAALFFPAEEYHQKYLEKRGIDACH
jgi:peptide-methionine (S)-S-oxide reductase